MTTTPAEDGLAALRAYVNTDATQDAYLGTCWAEAEALVTAHVGSASVPAAVHARAVLEVGAELYHRRNAPGGVIAAYADLGAAPVRVARDPMVAAYPLLAPYLPGGFA